LAHKDKLLESAQKFLIKGQLAKAIDEYQKLAEAFPRDFRNLQKLAELLCREQRYSEALPYFETVARNFTETGFYLKAVAIFKQMQKIDPSRADTSLRIAELYEKQGLIGSALSEYRHLYLDYERNGQLHEALAVLPKIISLDPDNTALRFRLIESLVAVGEEGQALEAFRALVWMLAGKGEHASTVRLYEQFQALCPTDLGSQLPLATALLSCGQTDTALALLRNLLSQDPEHREALLALCVGYLAAGNPGEARLACERLLEVHPRDAEVVEYYIRSCIANGDIKRAVDCLADSMELFVQAGRSATYQQFCTALQVTLPEDARLQEMLAAAGHAAGVSAAAEIGSAQAGAALVPKHIGSLSVSTRDAAAASSPAEEPDATASPVFELELEFELDGLGALGIESLACEHAGTSGLVVPERKAEAGQALPPSGADIAADDTIEALDELLAPGTLADLEILSKVEDEPGAAGGSDEDAQSHFDLGIAYKEMGRYQAAINEFEIAASDPSRRLDCLTLKGQCLADQGAMAAAEATFREALAQPSLTDDMHMVLRYELGLLYEKSGRPLEALESFQFVAERDQFFREVASKLQALRRQLGLDDPNLPPGGESGGSDRISYL
jgi:tetratricopeptide (TPR) repeat protein